MTAYSSLALKLHSPLSDIASGRFLVRILRPQRAGINVFCCSANTSTFTCRSALELWVLPSFSNSAPHIFYILLEWFGRKEASSCTATSRLWSRQPAEFVNRFNQAFFALWFVRNHMLSIGLIGVIVISLRLYPALLASIWALYDLLSTFKTIS